jgi:hypothetical protein
LIQAVVQNLAHGATFLAEVESGGSSLPGFVEGEFQRYFRCGVLAHGFARVRCASSHDELLVAFSCKGRGFCPSCGARRMHDTAAHLVTRVLPRVPVRQWVLSLPRWARFLLARDPGLITRALDLSLRALFAYQRKRARRAGTRSPRTGAVTFVQRFGGALNLNVHFHCVLPDGVFARINGAVEFVALPPPSPDDVLALLARIVARLERLLRPRLLTLQADATQPDSLAAAQAESLHSLGSPPKPQGRSDQRAAFLKGFSLHAGVHLHANDRQGLEHLCRYGARPPFSQQRLTALSDGRLSYQLKRPLGDGRTALLLQPTEFLRRLATLVPPPRAHLVRYHGVFAPASRWRREVIPAPEPAKASPLADETAPPIHVTSAPRNKRSSRIPWAELLQRVFREDVLSCPCGGRRVVLAYVTGSKAVKAILDHLGLASTGPPVSPARSSGFADAAWQDDVPTLQQSSR